LDFDPFNPKAQTGKQMAFPSPSRTFSFKAKKNSKPNSTKSGILAVDRVPPQVYFIQLVYNPSGWALAEKGKRRKNEREKQFPPSAFFILLPTYNKKKRTRLTVILV
jgi:hypothetical protein